MSEVQVSTADRQEIVPFAQAKVKIAELLQRNERGFTNALGGSQSFARFARIVLTVCERNPDLYKCDRSSLLLSCFRVAQLGLSPDPSLGQAWLIPRKDKAEFQLGYKGVLQLAYRSPLVSAIRYGVVREGDRFEFVDGKNYRLLHVPTGQGWPTKPAETIAAWCIVELRSGGSIPRVMFTPEIERHRSRGQGSQPAWSTDYAAMCAKTVIGDACRRAPVNTEAAQALGLDEAGDLEKGQPATDEPEVIDVAEVIPSDKTAAFIAAYGKPVPTEEQGMSREAFARVEAAAQAAGMTLADLSAAWGGKDLLLATPNDETELLRLVAQGKRGKR